MILRLSDGADRAQTNAFKELISDNLSMCREAIPPACRFRQRELAPQGARIVQVMN